MFKKLGVIGIALTAIALLSGARPAGAALDAGKVRLPKAIKYQGKTVDKGTYTVRIEEAADGPTVALYGKDGERIVAELAIVEIGKGNVKKPHATVAVINRGGPFVRLLVTSGKTRYRAYFEPAS